MQFLQKFTDSPVSVPSAGSPIILQTFNADGTIRAGMAENFDSVGQNPHFNRLTDVISLMVDRIGQSFFDRRIRIVEVTVGFGDIWQLFNPLGDDAVADILK